MTDIIETLVIWTAAIVIWIAVSILRAVVIIAVACLVCWGLDWIGMTIADKDTYTALVAALIVFDIVVRERGNKEDDC